MSILHACHHASHSLNILIIAYIYIYYFTITITMDFITFNNFTNRKNAVYIFRRKIHAHVMKSASRSYRGSAYTRKYMQLLNENTTKLKNNTTQQTVYKSISMESSNNAVKRSQKRERSHLLFKKRSLFHSCQSLLAHIEKIEWLHWACVHLPLIGSSFTCSHFVNASINDRCAH